MAQPRHTLGTFAGPDTPIGHAATAAIIAADSDIASMSERAKRITDGAQAMAGGAFDYTSRMKAVEAYDKAALSHDNVSALATARGNVAAGRSHANAAAACRAASCALVEKVYG